MCGATGMLENDARGDELERTVTRMTDTLAHRGPDGSGVWVDAAAGVALGHRRLAVVDLSSEGRQPMRSACGRYVTTFNGEIYNFPALRRILEGKSHRFRGHSDTEVMLAAFTEWGIEEGLRYLNGMFALAVWDAEDRSLVLARDRLGEKPLYYGWAGSTFLFGSELKALRAHPAFRPEIDREALGLFFRHKYVPYPRSIYAGVRKVVPGTFLRVRRGDRSVRPKPYWSLRAAADRGLAEPFAGSDEEAVEALDVLLRDAVGLRMHADVPLGAFLSGGVDSSTVVALMQAQSARPVRTFTIGWHDPAYNEAEDAAAVAAHLGTDHTELYVTPEDALAVIPRLPRLYDEPFSDSSQVPVFLVSEMARRHVTVSLSGDGGDELFGGYNRHHAGLRMWRRIGRMPKGVRRVAARALGGVPPAAWDRIYRRVDPALPGTGHRNVGDKVQKLAGVIAADGLEEMYLRLVSHWTPPETPVIGAGAPASVFGDPADWPATSDFAQTMMYLDAATYLPDDILTKLDRASMGVSLEGRVPLLDHRVVELAWRLPLRMKIRDGRGKWILRRVLDRYVPAQLVDRAKMGFGIPIGDWLRGPLREWAEGLLGDARLRDEGFLDPAPIRAKWDEHLAGRRNWQYHLWDVLIFQSWLEEERSARRVGARS